jgi:hypothetical protein
VSGKSQCDHHEGSFIILHSIVKKKRKEGKKEKRKARCQWLTPVILATQEVKIRKIAVQGQPRETVPKTLS